jgi:hypothetical protein
MQNYHMLNRPNREITDLSEITGILKKGKYVIISMCRGNEPYIVTLSYGYDSENNALYFHCATQGLKLDFLMENPQVCATVIEDGGYVPDECGHLYKTAVFWGTMEILNDIEDKRYGIKVLLNHLESKPDIIDEKMLKAEGRYARMAVLRLQITRIHGKSGR